MTEDRYKQGEFWWLDEHCFVDEDSQEIIAEKEGSRVSVSQLEKLIPLYGECLNCRSEIEVRKTISSFGREEGVSAGEVYSSAVFSVYGTQLHQLQYFTQLFERTKVLGRKPNEQDFKHTFLYKEEDYYNTLVEIAKLAGENEDLFDAERYWLAWRRNGHNFTIPERKYCVIEPEIIRLLWEDEARGLKMVKKFRKNIGKIDREKLDPYSMLLMNEVMFVTNISFENSNLQMTTMLDEVTIPKDFPKKPVRIIDYKTGREFGELTNVSQMQIFIMKLGVYANIFNKLSSLRFGPDSWDLAHSTAKLPFVSKRSLKTPSIGSLTEEGLMEGIAMMDELIQFSYVNPVSQEVADMHIDVMACFDFLRELNSFYAKYKKEIRPVISKKNAKFYLPQFPVKNFRQGNVLEKKLQPRVI